jgi:hypothetical protein
MSSGPGRRPFPQPSSFEVEPIKSGYVGPDGFADYKQCARCWQRGISYILSPSLVVDEARRYLTELGLTVFSPVHNVGPGPAEVVAPADLAALDTCDRVFAILDGLDTGTVFEVGYARAKNLPVYVLAQSVSEEDLKMVSGSNCNVFFDFVTALHHTAWKA